jgi:two-component system, cell cycle sensor histidine kinase and response regulator CckA
VPQRPGIKVLFLSGYADDPLFREGVLRGSSAFLQKPFTPETLIQAIRALSDP